MEFRRVLFRSTAKLLTAVDDMSVDARRANARDDAFEFGCRGRAAVGADVELRQLAVEQARDMAADRMGVVEDELAVRRFQEVELGGQLCVVGAARVIATLRDRRFLCVANAISPFSLSSPLAAQPRPSRTVISG